MGVRVGGFCDDDLGVSIQSSGPNGDMDTVGGHIRTQP